LKLAKRLLVLIGLALLVWVGLQYFTSDEQRIKSLLPKLATTASVKADENLIGRALKAERVIGFFADSVSLEIEGPRDVMPKIETKTDIQQSMMALYQQTRDFDLKFLDILVKVADDKQSASVFTTALVRATGETQPYGQELKIKFDKVQGRWLIKRIEAIQTIQ
jgi:hypothetical protein